MRYLYYITAIIILATLALVWVVNRDTRPENPDAVLTVNGRQFTAGELAERQQHSPYHDRSQQEFIDQLVTRELLIQEARREGIDREEQFRRSIQDYFEQSLIKVLTDRRMEAENISVSLEEIAAYRRACGFHMHLRLQQYSDPGSSGGGKLLHEEDLDAPFTQFPVGIQLRVMGLVPGSSTKPYPIEEGYGIVKLLRRTPLPKPPAPPGNEQIVRLLKGAKRQQQFDQWLARLRKKANIKVRLGAAGEGGNHG